MFNLKKENTKVEISLSIDPKQWEEGVEKVYQSSKGKFNVVGFRKGHAPRKVIEKQYGDNIFFEDTVEYFVNQTLNEVLNEHPELEPVVMPTTQFESFTVSDGLKMKILFEIVPDFELCNYKGVEVEVHDAKVTDAEIEHEIGHLLEDNAKFEDVEREVKNGDSVLIDFVGYIDDVAFEGGEGRDYLLEIGSHTFIDNFEEQLIGHKKGEKVDVNVTFPENYGAPEFAGKKAVFKVDIKQVREKTLPTLDDKFVADTTEFETVEEYRNHIMAHIQTMKNNQQDNEFEYNMREHLLSNTNVEIPDSMVEAYVSQDLDRMRQALAAYNVTVEDYLAQTGSNLESYMKEAKERTLKSIKTRYIYRKLLEENKIEVSKEELEKATEGMKDEHDITRKENELLLEKLQAFLKANNTVKIVKDEE